MARLERLTLVVCFFVCPLLFFTNLTRNPYITQISLLNVGLCAALALRWGRSAWEEGALRLARTPFDLPLGVWLGLCAVSWGVAYLGHAEFFRPSIRAEGLRNAVFVIANTVAAFYLAAAVAREDAVRRPEEPTAAPGRRGDGAGEDPAMSAGLGWWVLFALAWGALWLGFHSMRSPGRAGGGLLATVWDGFGGPLWLGGIGAAWWLCRKGRMLDYIHLSLAAAFLASAYGILQYFNIEVIWPTVLNPYGGRSVSTFGNPNFLSSYNVVLLPFAAALFLNARGAFAKAAYGIVFLALEGALLASLTRSSWGGAIAALGVLAVWRQTRLRALEEPRPQGLLAGLALVMVLAWPQSSVGGAYTPSVIGRLTEIRTFRQADGYYSPLHQRVLIWSCAWLMGAENPLTGKGWGVFELFYPFYQGTMLRHSDFFHRMRTHANNAHNEIMETWAQTGLTGVGVLFWMWAVFFRAASSQAPPGRTAVSWMGPAAAAGAAGMLVDNLLNVSLHFAVPGFIFWWAAGTAMGRLEVVPAWREMNSRRAVIAGALAAAAGLGAVSWYWVRVWNREVHYFSGFKLLRQGAVGAATKELERSRSWGPGEVNAVYELGNAYARSERFENALSAYGEALAANAGYDEIYFNRATILALRLKMTGEALKNYQVAALINPLSNEVLSGLSALYLQEPKAHMQESLELLRLAVRAFPDNANHWNNLGYVHSLRGAFAEAQEAYGRALAIDPGMVVAERNLAAVVRQAGGPVPPFVQGLDDIRRLEAMLARSDYSPAALSLAERASRLLPASPKPRFFLGSLLLVHGRPAEAIGHLEWVVRREPRHLQARLNLGNAYLSLSRGEAAAREFRAVLGVDPANAAAQKGLQALGLPR